MTIFRRVFIYPLLSVEEEAGSMHFLRPVLLVLSLLLITVAVVLLLFFPTCVVRALLYGVTGIVGLILRALALHGYVRLARWLGIGALLAIMVGLYITPGGMRAWALTADIAVVVAAFTLGSSQAIVVAAVAAIIGLVLAIVESQTTLIAAYVAPSLLTIWLVNSLGVLALAALIALAARNLNHSLERARRSERETVALNRALEREKEALQKSEERHRVTSELIWDYAYAYDVGPDGTFSPRWITDISFTRLSGYTWQEIASTFNLYHPEDRERVEQDVQRTIQGETTQAEYRIVTKSGEVRWLHLRRRPMWDAGQNRVVQFYGAAQDITERKRAEAQRLELALEKEKVALLRTFISNITHDLKTPLTAINTNLYLLEKRSDPDYQRSRLEHIREQTQRLDKLIQDLLTLSRLDYLPQFNLTRINLNELVRDIGRQTEAAVERKRQRFSLDLDSQMPAIVADPLELNRAILNLVENAIHYTPEEHSITVRTAMTALGACVEVSDTGIGISGDDLPHIFEPFYRAEEARSSVSGGAGLGLAIVQRIIHAHGGQIEVESVLDQGSTFRVVLPTNAEQAVST
jgi:PAS domain S-box-containing protein